MAPLIDFDNEPPSTGSLQHNGLAEPVIDLTDTSPDQLLMNGIAPLIDLPNDRTGGVVHKNVASNEMCASGEGREEVEGGEVREVDGDVESVSGSQELF